MQTNTKPQQRMSKTNGPTEEPGADLDVRRSDVIEYVRNLRCSSAVLQEAATDRLADTVWNSISGTREGAETVLKGLQEERKIEQTFLISWLSMWIWVCGPFLAADGAAFALKDASLRLGLCIACAVIITVASWIFYRPIENAIDAVDHRHLQVLAITRFVRPDWGFWWRIKGNEDITHRSTFSGLRKAILAVASIAWLFPLLAFFLRSKINI